MIVPDGQSFDYIVVGSGAAGAAAASRLALAGEDVLLVEAGGDPGPISRVNKKQLPITIFLSHSFVLFY
jgi:choline dehydrogenase-like flavoprotein